jgi:hypothetical protein
MARHDLRREKKTGTYALTTRLRQPLVPHVSMDFGSGTSILEEGTVEETQMQGQKQYTITRHMHPLLFFFEQSVYHIFFFFFTCCILLFWDGE